MIVLVEVLFVLIRNDGHFRYLSFLIIDPEAQGKGVGSALMDWGFQQADKADPPLPVVLESSAPGRPLYEKRGFVACGDIHVLGAPTFPIMVRPPRATQ
jgi:GNAT superfamily N-acetyltransferase